MRTSLDEAHVSQIADVVEQLYDETGIDRVEVLQRVRGIAKAVHATQDIWL
nr:hypothetical protein [uncultured Albidiferax sp.]